MLLGFDVGGTNARALLIDPVNGDIIDRSLESSAGEGPVLLETLVGMVERIRADSPGDVESMGLAVAGLSHRSGVVRYSPNLPDLVEYPLGTELSSRVDLPVTLMNDATAATWAEAQLGAGRGSNDFIMVTLGTGIGSGFVCGGRLIEGHNGFAGETGHMVIDAGGPSHHTGQPGPWEYYASGSALGRAGRSHAEAGAWPSATSFVESIEAITGSTVAQAAQQGDEAALRMVDDFCRQVALGLANLVLAFDPERVVLGGGVANIGETLRSGVDHWLRELTLGAQHRPAVEVLIAELGDDAGAIGAALWAAEQTNGVSS